MLKKHFFLWALISAINYIYSEDVNADWLIVGAGPAGIITIGVLIDLGIKPESIAWVDPEFNVGRMGKYYSTVPGNTKTKKFIEFLENCKIFQECSSEAVKTLCQYDQDKEYALDLIISPLNDITNYLRTKVYSRIGWLSYLDRDPISSNWVAKTINKTGHSNIVAKHVVIATGSHPSSLNYPGLIELPLDDALNPANLAHMVNPEDRVLVVGSSHSAILILKYLTELEKPVKKIISIYNKPLIYPIDMGDWVQNMHSGLKGITAEWAHEHLEKNLPANLERLFNSQENIDLAIKACNKVVYAIGFHRNSLPYIKENPDLTYDKNGMIAPGLFGIGIAFPEHYVDPLNNKETPVGLNSFLAYAQKVAPNWLENKVKSNSIIKNIKNLEDIFEIYVV